MPRVSVITPAKDAAATLPALLDALSALTPVDGGFEVIVVDDASSDATRRLAAGHPVVTRVVDGGGRGPGAARNAGAAAASAPILAFTDADCLPEPGWLAGMLAALDDADLVQGVVRPAGPMGPWDRSVSVERFSGLFETANLGVRRDWFERIGGFEPWLAPRRSKELGEDVWLGWRLRRAGGRCAFAPDAIVAHAVFPGTPGSYVAERLRLRFFPELARRIPELRGLFFWRRVFLSRRTAALDLAVACTVVAVARRRPALLVATVPYGRIVWGRARHHGRRRGLLVAAVDAVADLAGLGALVAGSIRARSPLL